MSPDATGTPYGNGAGLARQPQPAYRRSSAAGNDIDVYREWANAIVHGETGSAPSRRYASGMVALRPDGDGQITGYTGVEELQRQHGEWVIDAHLPAVSCWRTGPG